MVFWFVGGTFVICPVLLITNNWFLLDWVGKESRGDLCNVSTLETRLDVDKGTRAHTHSYQLPDDCVEKHELWLANRCINNFTRGMRY